MISYASNIIRSLLPKNTFARSVSVLVGGTTGAQLLTVVAAPMLTRLYSPEDFGLLAVYASLLGLVAVVSSLCYELAIPLPEDDVEAAKVATLSMLLVVVATIFSGVFVALFNAPIARKLGVPMLAGYLWLLPVGVLLGGAYKVIRYWSVRTKRFSDIASTRMCQSLASLVIQLAAYKLGGLTLLLGQVAGQSVGTYSLARPVLAMPTFRQVRWRGVWEAAVRYRRFPIFTTWAGLLNTGGTQLPPLMIAGFFSAAGVGLYALAHRVLTLPMSFIGTALQSVFLSCASEAYRNNQLGDKVHRLLDTLTQISVVFGAILVLISPDLFAIVFGDDWRQAGVLAQWMTPWLVLQFCTGPLAIVNTVAETQHLGLIMQAQLFIVRVVMIVIGSYYGDITFTVMLFSIGSAISYFIFLWTILSISGLSISVFIRSLFKALGFAIVIVSPILIFPSLMLDWMMTVLICFIVVSLTTIRLVILFRYQR